MTYIGLSGDDNNANADDDDNILTEGIHGFSQPLQETDGQYLKIRSCPIRSTAFPILHATIILSFDDM